MKKVTVLTAMLVSVLVSSCGTLTANTQIGEIHVPVNLSGTLNVSDKAAQAIAGEIIGVDKGSIGTLLSRAQSKFKAAYLKQEKRGEIL